MHLSTYPDPYEVTALHEKRMKRLQALQVAGPITTPSVSRREHSQRKIPHSFTELRARTSAYYNHSRSARLIEWICRVRMMVPCASMNETIWAQQIPIEDIYGALHHIEAIRNLGS